MTRFDRVIPPGGEGKVTLNVDLKGYQGKVWKDATIISNDLRQPSFQIMLQGQVRPHIELRPGSFVQFSPAAQSAEEKTVDLVATGQDFKVLKVENNLKEKISAQLETIVPGKALPPQDRQSPAGGVLCRRDQVLHRPPQKTGSSDTDQRPFPPSKIDAPP